MTAPGFLAARLVLSFKVLLLFFVVMVLAATAFEVLCFVTRFFCVLAAQTARIPSVVLRVPRVRRLRDGDGAVVLMLRRATEAGGLLLSVAFDLATCCAGRFTGTARSPAESSSCLYYPSI